MRDPITLQTRRRLISRSPTLDLGTSDGSWISNGDRVSCVYRLLMASILMGD